MNFHDAVCAGGGRVLLCAALTGFFPASQNARAQQPTTSATLSATTDNTAASDQSRSVPGAVAANNGTSSSADPATPTGQQQGFTPADPPAPAIVPDPAPAAAAATAASATAATDTTQQGGFWKRLADAYWTDWFPPASATTDIPKYRGYPPPEDNPPYPFSVWPIGGTVWIGYPNATSYPLTTALYGSKHGQWLKDHNIQIYGWANAGMNFSTSTQAVGGKYANAPAAYNQIPNSIQLDQLTMYIERVPDTIQTDHFDWGFRLTNLYGFDYRFTTSKGILSQQLLTPQNNGTIGQTYGYDPVMMYIDLYFPHVAQGMILRIGRYVSLPDIEAQLAPNNYTYTHSLTYTYDCYTQTGINATIKLNDHWTAQFGVSPGCDTMAWEPDAKATFNTCIAYNWSDGGDNVYLCANSINDGKYAYNNLAAYYATWYHKINTKWHTAFESWYQYESDTPNIFNSVGQTLIETNADGAWCASPSQVTCFAPEWTMLNYTNRQFSKHNFISFRNEYFDDIRGQRTGYKDRYVETGVSWNHWVGSTVVF